jgi:FkbM family methyltransferase
MIFILKTSSRNIIYRILKKISFYNFFQREEINYKTYDSLKLEGFSINNQKDLWRITNDTLCFYLRKGGSDSKVFNHIFVSKEYHPLIELIKSNKISIKNLIDVGANIGLATIYIDKHLPNLKIVSIEPDEDNFNLLIQNLGSLKNQNIEKLNLALWHKREVLYKDRSFRDGEEWSYTFDVRKNICCNFPSGNEVKGITIHDVINDFKLDEIGILKLDIEGAERFLFDKKISDLSFLNITKILALEIHDEFNIRQKIYNILLEHHFSFFNSGELTIAINSNLCKVDSNWN